MSSIARKAVFFIRAYNDMDHLTPVIWKLATTTDVSISVVVRIGKTIPDDYRLNYLRQFERVELRHISEFIAEDSTPAARLSLLSRISYRLKSDNASSQPTIKSKHETDPAAVEKMLDALFGTGETAARYGIVIFDWVTLSKANRNFAITVKEAAGQRGYANLSLPHGDSPYWNAMFKMEDIDYSAMEHYRDNPLDVVVVPNPLTAKRFTSFRNDDQLRIIGSARYNDEWMGELKTLLPPFDIPGTDKMLKLVMFLRNAEFPINWEQVIYSIRLATQFRDVYLVVKHHTRGGTEDNPNMREHLEMGKLNQMTAPNLKIVYSDIHSGSLLQWADAVLELGTSISFEAIKLNKPLLAMEYLHANISTTAHFLPQTAMRCKDDLFDAIQALRQNRETRFYTDAERQRFIHEIIDYPDGHVLERYVELIQSLMATRVPAVAMAVPMMENTQS
jgi:hypothetical protein